MQSRRSFLTTAGTVGLATLMPKTYSEEVTTYPQEQSLTNSQKVQQIIGEHGIPYDYHYERIVGKRILRMDLELSEEKLKIVVKRKLKAGFFKGATYRLEIIDQSNSGNYGTIDEMRFSFSDNSDKSDEKIKTSIEETRQAPFPQHIDKAVSQIYSNTLNQIINKTQEISQDDLVRIKDFCRRNFPVPNNKF